MPRCYEQFDFNFTGTKNSAKHIFFFFVIRVLVVISFVTDRVRVQNKNKIYCSVRVFYGSTGKKGLTDGENKVGNPLR